MPGATLTVPVSPSWPRGPLDLGPTSEASIKPAPTTPAKFAIVGAISAMVPPTLIAIHALGDTGCWMIRASVLAGLVQAP